MPIDTLRERLDALFPQIQCRRCGAPDCRAYAQAVAVGEMDFNRCTPGGDQTILALAATLGREPRALADECAGWVEGGTARIDEARCIGCALCLSACPVDAIVGARRRMHTVIDSECTGCELCIEPCPVDCIEMLAAGSPPADRQAVLSGAPRARARYRAHLQRLQSRRVRRTPKQHSRAALRSEILAAVARVRERRADPGDR